MKLKLILILIFLIPISSAYSDNSSFFTCYNSTDCTNALQDSKYTIVKLGADNTTTGTFLNDPTITDNKVFDGQGYTIKGNAAGGSYFWKRQGSGIKDNITLKNITVDKFESGVVFHTTNGKILNVIFKNITAGNVVETYYGNGNLIQNNTFSNQSNTNSVIYLFNGLNHIVDNNSFFNLTSASSAIEVSGSLNNIISNNTILNSSEAFSYGVVYIHAASNNTTILRNTFINGNIANLAISRDVGIWSSNYTSVYSNTFTNSTGHHAIFLEFSNFNNIYNNSMTTKDSAVALVGSSDNVIYNNNIKNSSYIDPNNNPIGFETDSMEIDGGSNNNTFRNNTIDGIIIPFWLYPVGHPELGNISNNKIINNIILNSYEGISAQGFSTTNVTNTTIENNTGTLLNNSPSYTSINIYNTKVYNTIGCGNIGTVWLQSGTDITNVVSNITQSCYLFYPEIIINSGRLRSNGSYVIESSSATYTLSTLKNLSVIILPGFLGNIIPISGNGLNIIPSSDSVNVTISVWNTSGDYNKTWTENSSNHSVTTQHTIGDLPISSSVDLYLDGVRQNTLLTNSTGYISFTYVGGYSEHTFEIVLTPTLAQQIQSSKISTCTSTRSYSDIAIPLFGLALMIFGFGTIIITLRSQTLTSAVLIASITSTVVGFGLILIGNYLLYQIYTVTC